MAPDEASRQAIKTEKRGRAAKSQDVLRQCAVSRECLPTDQMIRFVLSPDEMVTPDLKRKLPGRGVWLTARHSTVEQALKRRAFDRGFKKKVHVPDDLATLIEKLLCKEALNALSLANKAGDVLTGYEKIREALRRDEITALLHAIEASDNGSNKLDRLIAPHRAFEDDEDRASRVLPRLFTANELSLALGRGNVVHIGLKRGEAARRFQQALQKAATYATEEGVALSNG